MRKQNSQWRSLEEVLTFLEDEGYKKAVLQSLHIIPGVEFQKVVEASKKSKLETAVGLPLFFAEQDFLSTIDALSDTIPDDTEWATVLVGHGTYHPAGSAYLTLERYIKKRYPKNVYISVVDGEPSWQETLDSIRMSDVRKVKFVPLMFVAGEHVLKDILGRNQETAENSWKMQLAGYEVDACEKGLGYNAKIQMIYFQHLQQAMQKIINHSNNFRPK
jgi:sirohydrochlorin cobaltochelatase